MLKQFFKQTNLKPLWLFGVHSAFLHLNTIGEYKLSTEIVLRFASGFHYYGIIKKSEGPASFFSFNKNIC